LPRRPIDIEEAVQLFPTLRQSLLGTFDNCPLSTLFDLKYANGWSTHPQARGTLFHRYAAECLRLMKTYGDRDPRDGTSSIPVAEALEVLYDVVRQRDVPWRDRIRCSLRDLRELRISAIKWAAENRFTVDAIIDIERRLSTTLRYDGPGGQLVERVFTGQPDVLIAKPPDGAVVIDWKDTWALPPERVERQDPRDAERGDADHISYEGYFQQRAYALLILHEFPAVQWVTLREFYPRKTKVREATVHRSQLEHIEREFAILAEDFDLHVMAGTDQRPWHPSPGKHCSFCVTPGRCPIPDEARGQGAIRNERQAQRYVAQLQVAETVRTHRREALRPWIELHGPVEAKSAKGRHVAMLKPTRRKVTLKSGAVVYRDGVQLGVFPAEDSDRATATPSDAQLAEAMEQSVAEAREARDAAKRARKRQRTPA
jgi:hypothetical protein